MSRLVARNAQQSVSLQLGRDKCLSEASRNSVCRAHRSEPLSCHYFKATIREVMKSFYQLDSIHTCLPERSSIGREEMERNPESLVVHLHQTSLFVRIRVSPAPNADSRCALCVQIQKLNPSAPKMQCNSSKSHPNLIQSVFPFNLRHTSRL